MIVPLPAISTPFLRGGDVWTSPLANVSHGVDVSLSYPPASPHTNCWAPPHFPFSKSRICLRICLQNSPGDAKALLYKTQAMRSTVLTPGLWEFLDGMPLTMSATLNYHSAFYCLTACYWREEGSSMQPCALTGVQTSGTENAQQQALHIVRRDTDSLLPMSLVTAC